MVLIPQPSKIYYWAWKNWVLASYSEYTPSLQLQRCRHRSRMICLSVFLFVCLLPHYHGFTVLQNTAKKTIYKDDWKHGCAVRKWSASHVYAFMCAVFTYMVSRWIDLWLDLFVNVPSSNRFLLINPFKTQPQHKNRSGDSLSSAIRLLPSQSWLLRIKSGGERSTSFSASIHPLLRTKVKKHKLFHSVTVLCF